MSRTWHVISGASNSGKTTLLTELAARGYAVVPERATPILHRLASVGFGMDLVRDHLPLFHALVMADQVEVELSLDPHATYFLDRSRVDALVLPMARGSNGLDLLRRCLGSAQYGKVFLLEPIEVADWSSRVEDPEDPDEVGRQRTLLAEVYRQHGQEVVHVSAASTSERADLVETVIVQGAISDSER